MGGPCGVKGAKPPSHSGRGGSGRNSPSTGHHRSLQLNFQHERPIRLLLVCKHGRAPPFAPRTRGHEGPPNQAQLNIVCTPTWERTSREQRVTVVFALSGGNPDPAPIK